MIIGDVSLQVVATGLGYKLRSQGILGITLVILSIKLKKRTRSTLRTPRRVIDWKVSYGFGQARSTYSHSMVLGGFEDIS